MILGVDWGALGELEVSQYYKAVHMPVAVRYDLRVLSGEKR